MRSTPLYSYTWQLWCEEEDEGGSSWVVCVLPAKVAACSETAVPQSPSGCGTLALGDRPAGAELLRSGGAKDVAAAAAATLSEDDEMVAGACALYRRTVRAVDGWAGSIPVSRHLCGWIERTLGEPGKKAGLETGITGDSLQARVHA